MNLRFWRRHHRYEPPYESPEETAAWKAFARANRTTVELLKDGGWLEPCTEPDHCADGWHYMSLARRVLRFEG